MRAEGRRLKKVSVEAVLEKRADHSVVWPREAVSPALGCADRGQLPAKRDATFVRVLLHTLSVIEVNLFSNYFNFMFDMML